MAQKLDGNFHTRMIQTTCTGRIDPTYVIDAFAKGADGVMIAGCPPGDCHYITGNYKANRNYLLLKKTLAQMGIEPERLAANWLPAAESDRMLASLNEFAKRVAKLGPVNAN
jgi:F420-non-reducing hydrogenase iron-sulfur subunit